MLPLQGIIDESDIPQSVNFLKFKPCTWRELKKKIHEAREDQRVFFRMEMNISRSKVVGVRLLHSYKVKSDIVMPWDEV